MNRLPLTEMERNLYNCASREQAAELIAGFSKKALMELARELDVYVTPNDNKERIGEKVIAATTGVRLRSEAIATMRLR